MNKRALVKKIIAQLNGGRELYAKAARAAHAEATHEQNKAENKYDTRGLEASYLARGQSRQFAEVEQSIAQFEALALRDFGPEDAIDLGAFVELEGRDGRMCCFIGPRAGGTEVVHQKREVLVITPPSPLGQQLMGRKQDDLVRIEIAGGRQDYRIVAVA